MKISISPADVLDLLRSSLRAMLTVDTIRQLRSFVGKPPYALLKTSPPSDILNIAATFATVVRVA